jgi:hypothetical protein
MHHHSNILISQNHCEISESETKWKRNKSQQGDPSHWQSIFAVNITSMVIRAAAAV